MSRLIVNTIEVEKTLTNYCEEWEMLILKSGNLSITKQDKVYNLTNRNIAFFAPNEFHSIVRILVDSIRCDYISIWLYLCNALYV